MLAKLLQTNNLRLRTIQETLTVLDTRSEGAACHIVTGMDEDIHTDVLGWELVSAEHNIGRLRPLAWRDGAPTYQIVLVLAHIEPLIAVCQPDCVRFEVKGDWFFVRALFEGSTAVEIVCSLGAVFADKAQWVSTCVSVFQSEQEQAPYSARAACTHAASASTGNTPFCIRP